MGHSSRSCYLTGLPITGDTPAVLIVMKMRDKLYDVSDGHLKKFGSTTLISNDGTQLKFRPVWYPIHIIYDEYGGAKTIRKDENTEVLEKHYGLTIKQIIDIVCLGRKEGGYEGWAIWRKGKKIKTTKEEYDADFKDLLSYSAMWVHGDVYNELTNNRTNAYYDKFDVGAPELLNALGFEAVGIDEKEDRNNLLFKKGKLTIHSDGTCVNVPKECIYSLSELKKYCQKRGEDIDIEDVNKKDRMEQIFDYILPNVYSINDGINGFANVAKATELFEKMSEEEKNSEKGKELLKRSLRSMDSRSNHRTIKIIRSMFLNNEEYEYYNPLTLPYFNAAKEGKLRENLVRFWRFDHYVYVTGKYYNIVGTSPQDGEHKDVLKILKVATAILQKEVDEKNNG